jgi:hypothetical protein
LLSGPFAIKKEDAADSMERVDWIDNL